MEANQTLLKIVCRREGTWILIPLLFLVCLSVNQKFVSGEVVHITVMTVGQADVNNNRGSRQFQCYPSEPDVNTITLTFGRTALIPSSEAPPPPASYIHPNANPAQGIKIVKFGTDVSWDTDAFGPFYCQGSKDDRDDTKVSTFFQRSDAKFSPSDGVFTRMVNVGDEGVSINMTQLSEPESPGKAVCWRKNGGAEESCSSLSYQFTSPIQASDEAIYEIYFDTERSLSRGSLNRLIVRECAAGRWGPPHCHGVCDKCYNGGVCDDQSGLCICPNNFKGAHCLDICRSDGGNRFGLHCEFQCSYQNDGSGKCGNYLFCLPDPYGCSCDAGFKGLGCSEACEAGKYGAGCTQTCHCALGATCNRFSGICSNPAGCETGWSGENCQIPNVCDTGYYGVDCTSKCFCRNDVACNKATGECPNQECADGAMIYDAQVFCEECRRAFYGQHCEEQCRCQEAACNKVTGDCSGQCLPQWLLPNCEYGITRLTPQKVNPYVIMASFTCYITSDPLPADGTGMSLHHYSASTNTDDTDGITMEESRVDNGELAVTFTVSSVYLGDHDYVCSFHNNGITASLSIRLGTYVLPVLGEAPRVSSTTSTTVTMHWTAWTEGQDAGDPPVIGYTVYFTRSGDSNWVEAETVSGVLTSSAAVSGLESDTDYELSVAAIREGPSGTGPRSPAVDVTTLCGKPSAAPSGVSVTAVITRQLNVAWQVLSAADFSCRSAVKFYSVKYSPTQTREPVSVTNVTDVSAVLTNLEPYLEYTVSITANNKDAESDGSAPLTVRTAEEIAPPPSSLEVVHRTLRSLTVRWSAAQPQNLNGNVMQYEIMYQPVAMDSGSGVGKDVLDTSVDVEYHIENLMEKTNYSVMVRTVNGQGASNWSVPVYAVTMPFAESSSGPLVGGVVSGVLIIAIIIIVVVLILFRRRKQAAKEKPALISDHTKGSAVIYANAGCNMEEDHTYEQPLPPPVAERSTLQPVYLEPIAVVHLEQSRSEADAGATHVFRPCVDPVPVKEKSHSWDSLDQLDEKESGGGNSSGSRDQVNGVATGTQQRAGEIYENVASCSLPGAILVSELEDYIHSKQESSSDGLASEFKLLKKDQLHPWDVASREENKAKNRFRNIIAYDHSRVVLQKLDGDPNSDYYNANYIKNYKGEKMFIASQAPNTASLKSFWRMLWQENVSTVVMVTNLIEGGKDRCRQYWPKGPRQWETVGGFALFLTGVETYSDHVVRKITVLNRDAGDEDVEVEKRTVTQFHYLSWPDMGVPDYNTTLIELTESVRQHHTSTQRAGHTGPMLVHCSAGVGQTGTFIALYNMVDMMRDTGKVDIFGFVNQMREDRIKMVQTQEQYVFLYNAILEVSLSKDTESSVAKFKEKLASLNKHNSSRQKSNIQVEFENLHKLTPLPSPRSFRGGQDPLNQDKNRFPDILPMERNRPHLSTEGQADIKDYINASFINTYQRKDVFLATQCPLPNTVVDMWRLVFDWKCPVIVMLNPLSSGDKACAKYWPQEGSTQMGALEVTHVATSETANFVTRRFDVSLGAEAKLSVDQFEMLGWGVSSDKPDFPLALLQLVEAVEHKAKVSQSKGPIIVHCINGIGRSGVFCALWAVMERIRHNAKVNIFQAVKRLRDCRPNMVDSLDLYRLCYDAIGQHLQRFDEYANLDGL